MDRLDRRTLVKGTLAVAGGMGGAIYVRPSLRALGVPQALALSGGSGVTQFHPTLTFSPQAVIFNEISLASGSGWPPNARITIEVVPFGPRYYYVTADANGSFSNFPVNLSPAVAQTNIVSAYCSFRSTFVSTGASFILLASISLNPSSGPPGTTVYVSGIGFAGDGPINFYFDGQKVGYGVIQTDGVGAILGSGEASGYPNYSPTFVVPSSATTGVHQVSTTDGYHSNYKPVTATFTVT